MPRFTARLLSLFAALCLGLLGVAVFPRDAYACSCSGITTGTAARRADVIFQGRLLDKSVVRNPAPGRTEMRFEVSRVYKGEAYREQIVASPRGSNVCGLDPQLDSTWIIFAEEKIEGRGNDAVFRLVTQLCSGNLPGSTAPGILGRGQLPIEGASDRDEKAAATDAAFTHVLVVSGVVVAALALVVVTGLLILWRPGGPAGRVSR